MTSEQRRIYRRARRRANAKLSCMVHAVAYGMTILFLMALSPRAGLIVGLGWGIGLAMHWFFVMFAPALRDRFLDRELMRHTRSDVPRRRRHRGREDRWDEGPYSREVLDELARLERASEPGEATGAA